MTNLQTLKHSVLATNLIESETQGSLLNCSNPTASPCSGIGPSSIIIQVAGSSTFSAQLSCGASYVYISWALPYGVTIDVKFVGTSPTVVLSASSVASGSGIVQIEWCDSQNRHAVLQTSITVGCGGAVCSSTQWCYQNPSSGNSSCVGYAQAGQNCTGSTKCQPGLGCVNSVCISPSFPCLYNGVSPCAITITGATSFVANGQNNTFTIALGAACLPATYTSFNSSDTIGVNFYYAFQSNGLQITVNDLTKGRGTITVQICDSNFLYATKDISFDFHH